MGGGGPGRRAPEGREAGALEGELQKGGRWGPRREGRQDGAHKLKRNMLG